MRWRKPHRSLDKAWRTGGPRLAGVGFVAILLSCGGAAPAGGVAYSQAANAGGAVATAIAAGALWAVGGGCRLQGCPYGSYCNQKTGYCDVRKCSDGCPADTECNEGLGRCQAVAPPQTPTDILPQDDATLPPGTH